MRGRPRLVQDDAIVRAAYAVIGRAGPAGLTFGAVAREAGVAPATLAQRFGSKRGLLLAIAEHSAEQARALAAAPPGGAGPFLPRIADLVAESMTAMASPEEFANHLAFLCLDLSDPQLREHALAVAGAQRQILAGLVERAAAAGELRRGTDARALAASIQALAAGAGLMWALGREGTLGARLREEIGALLDRHRGPVDGGEWPHTGPPAGARTPAGGGNRLAGGEQPTGAEG